MRLQNVSVVGELALIHATTYCTVSTHSRYLLWRRQTQVSATGYEVYHVQYGAGGRLQVAFPFEQCPGTEIKLPTLHTQVGSYSKLDIALPNT